jgi:hypothetical protein
LYYLLIIAIVASEQMVSVDVLECTHGGVERLGEVLHEEFQENPIQGARSRIAHPKALKRGVRHVGRKGQLQRHYPGKLFSLNPERRAAYWNMRWLGAHANSAETLIYDVHSNDRPNLTAFSVGKRALKATMVGAWELGYDKCYLIDNPFARAVQNAALLENGVAEADFDTTSKQLHAKLGKLTLMDISELSARYDEMVADVAFFTKHQIPTTTEDDTLLPFILSLETVPAAEPFTPLDLSAEQRVLLGIPDDVDDVLAETWGHLNNSMIPPGLGETADGTPRRAWFGAYFLPAQPPVEDGDWVMFENVPRV